MARVVVSGYYGFHNLGDEAVLYSTIQSLRSLEPNLPITVLSGDPAHTARHYRVEAVDRWSPVAVFRALWKADLLLSGGGSLLQDVTGRRNLFYYIGVMVMAMMLGKPVVIYAQGIGPVRTRSGRRVIRWVLNRAAMISVRDPESRDDLLAMGVTRPPMAVTADPVLHLPDFAVPESEVDALLREAGVDLPSGKRLLLVAVRHWKNFSNAKKALAEVCDDLAGEGWSVLLLPMHRPPDIHACRAVAQEMRGPAAILERPLDIPEAMGLFARSGLVIGMRLHALIFAAVAGVPLVALSYDPKIDRFANRIGLTALLPVERIDSDQLRQAVREALVPGAAGERLAKQVAALRSQAERNVQWVSWVLPSMPAARDLPAGPSDFSKAHSPDTGAPFTSDR